MIKYSDNKSLANQDNFTGFFFDWPSPPTIQQQLDIINNSSEVIFAVDSDENKIIGFINALTDKVMYSFIPLIEVLPEYQNRAIGKELLSRMEEKLSKMYAIDLCCDSSVEEFYQKSGYYKLSGMIKRNHDVLK